MGIYFLVRVVEKLAISLKAATIFCIVILKMYYLLLYYKKNRVNYESVSFNFFLSKRRILDQN